MSISNINDYAPIIVFGYNRAKHIELVLNSLKNNSHSSDTILYIMLDGAKSENDIAKVSDTRRVVDCFAESNKESFKEIHIVKANNNKGLANSIITGVTEIIEKYGKVIVLEDDLITAPEFIDYMNGALDYYQNRNVWSISGYSFPFPSLLGRKQNVYGINRAMSWGWATWSDRWKKVDWTVSDYEEFISDAEKTARFNNSGMDMTYMLKQQMDGEIDSWAIRFCYSQFKYGMYTVCPKYTKIVNVGLDNSGIHSRSSILNLEKNYFLKDDVVEYIECPPEKRITAELRAFRNHKLLPRVLMRLFSIPFLVSITFKSNIR